jgi:uncharacterized membrane protein YoaK (UPF0700 family)
MLAFVGGSLDAFTYLNHGHVFAAAMTGNAVLLGIAMLDHDRLQALHHALPLVSFFCGVSLSLLVQRKLSRHAPTVGLAIEIFGLALLSFAPASFPDLIFAPAISVLAAYKWTASSS